MGNSSRYPEAESCAVLSLGGEKRFKDAYGVVSRNSATTIGDRDAKAEGMRPLFPIAGTC